MGVPVSYLLALQLVSLLNSLDKIYNAAYFFHSKLANQYRSLLCQEPNVLIEFHQSNNQSLKIRHLDHQF